MSWNFDPTRDPAARQLPAPQACSSGCSVARPTVGSYLPNVTVSCHPFIR
jgi:hypothetical protein